MSEFKTAVLSDGREVKVDIEAVKQSVRKVRDLRRIRNIEPLSDEHFELYQRYTGLKVDDMLEMETEDFQIIDKLVEQAMKEATGPNGR